MTEENDIRPLAAKTRLHQSYKHLTGVGRKKSQVAAATLGRELAGFVRAIGRMVQPRTVATAGEKQGTTKTKTADKTK